VGLLSTESGAQFESAGRYVTVVATVKEQWIVVRIAKYPDDLTYKNYMVATIMLAPAFAL